MTVPDPCSTRRRRNAVRTAAAGVVVATGLLAAACTQSGSPDLPTSTVTAVPVPPESVPTQDVPAPPVPSGPATVQVTDVRDVATGLDVPWGIAFLPDGTALVTLREQARLVRVTADGTVTDVTGPGADQLVQQVRPAGEGGLLGVAVLGAQGGGVDVVLYATTADDNRVLRGTFDGSTLGALRPVLTGIHKAGNHDGGRLAVGPDGALYVTTGDAGDRPDAQDPASLNGKILRVTPDGAPAPGNPDPDSPVWSLGHRNVQGIGWAADGRMFASEFGQDTWDELNVISPGGNYGWPVVEGSQGQGFVDPAVTWATSDASPSGLAVTGEAVYLAALRGQRLWRVPFSPGGTGTGLGEPQALLDGDEGYGRMRAVTVAPDGSLWVLTNNTDGRGDPRPGDDRILRVTVG